MIDVDILNIHSRYISSPKNMFSLLSFFFKYLMFNSPTHMLKCLKWRKWVFPHSLATEGAECKSFKTAITCLRVSRFLPEKNETCNNKRVNLLWKERKMSEWTRVHGQHCINKGEHHRVGRRIVYQYNAYCWQSELPTTSYRGPLASELPNSPRHFQTQLPIRSQARAPTDLYV